jgi:hypothetical protein
MPKLCCTCGFVHNLSSIPDDGWLTIRDRDQDELTPDDSTSPDQRIERWHELYRRSGLLYECPQCGRVMWKKRGETVFAIYRREESGG